MAIGNTGKSKISKSNTHRNASRTNATRTKSAKKNNPNEATPSKELMEMATPLIKEKIKRGVISKTDAHNLQRRLGVQTRRELMAVFAKYASDLLSLIHI